MEVVRNLQKKLNEFLSNFTLVNYIAIFSIVLIYGFSLKNVSSFSCLIENHKIYSAQGLVASNPVITSSGKYYKCDFIPSFVKSKKELSTFSTNGKITLLFPKEIIETHYPGKLYSTIGESIFVEEGSILNVQIEQLNKKTNESFFIVKKAEFLGWKNFLSKIRGFFRLQFKRLMYMWGNAGGLLLALLSSSKEYTSFEFSNAFRLAGLSHILALSGMHVSIFSTLTEKSFFKILGKNKTNFLSLIIVLLFVWFAGIAPSLTRAMISTIIIFITAKLNLKLKIIDILCLSFLIQLSIYPQDSSSISFILSYLALFGILTVGTYIKPFLTNFLGTTLSSSLSSSIGAVLVTIPVCAVIWGYITPIGIISTIFISPLVTFFLIFGLISVIICLIFPFFTYPLGTILQIVYYLIDNVATFFAKVPPIIF
mgnify:FL=1